MVSVSVQCALAATLVDDGTCLLDAADGPAPLAVDVWLNSRTEATGATEAAPALDEAAPEETAATPASAAELAPSQPADLGAADAAAVARE